MSSRRISKFSDTVFVAFEIVKVFPVISRQRISSSAIGYIKVQSDRHEIQLVPSRGLDPFDYYYSRLKKMYLFEHASSFVLTSSITIITLVQMVKSLSSLKSLYFVKDLATLFQNVGISQAIPG